ncbi:MAG: hypothetical protein AB1556_16865 [Bacillota bacterium]
MRPAGIGPAHHLIELLKFSALSKINFTAPGRHPNCPSHCRHCCYPPLPYQAVPDLEAEVERAVEESPSLWSLRGVFDPEQTVDFPVFLFRRAGNPEMMNFIFFGHLKTKVVQHQVSDHRHLWF